MMAHTAKWMVEERLRQAEGSPELRRYYALEYGGDEWPPTPIPRRWTRKRYRLGIRLRMAALQVAALLGRP